MPMKRAEEKRIISLSEFDHEVSLYQLIPAGTGKALCLLKRIVDYILTAKPEKIPTLLLTGEQGVTTLSRCYLRALALPFIKMVDGFFIQTCSGLPLIFGNRSRDAGYILSNVHQMDRAIQSHISDIVTKRHFELYNFFSEEREVHHVEGVLVLTANQIDQVPESIRNAIDYHIVVEPYTHEQRLLLILQRMKYCGLQYESESVLQAIEIFGDGKLRMMVYLLQLCITIVSTDGRTKITLNDLKKAADLLSPPKQSKS
jgi:hypothetical protein